MDEFEIGDKVEVIKEYDNYKVGDVVTITSTSESYRFGTFYRINGDRWGAPVYFFKKVEDKPMFKVGDKVKIIGNKNKSVNMVGDIGNIVEKFTDDIWRVSVEGRKQECNWTKGCDMELVKTVEYENEWHLNDGKVDIPGDADKLEKDGSVVAFRKRKAKPFEFGDELFGYLTGTKYRFIRYSNYLKTHCDALNSENMIATNQKLGEQLIRK